MFIIEFVAYTLLCVSVVYDIKFLGFIGLGIFALFEFLAIVRSVVYSKRTFVCLSCGKELKYKWGDLFRTYRNWGWCFPKEIVKNDTGVYKKVWVRCTHCGAYDLGYKAK